MLFFLDISELGVFDDSLKRCQRSSYEDGL